ncbi:MAG: cupredoxin domain-containing protein [Candidatus Micrarchaeia archaeon]|jgi:plastocyanin
MGNEKLMFGAAVVIAIAFFGFMLMGSNAQGISSHPIDENAKPTYEPPQGGAGGAPPGSGATQEVSLTATGSGYDKNEIRVKAGVPVHFTFTANNAGCCAQLLIDRVGVQLVSRNGQAVDATFTPPTPGNYPYHCGMNMCRGVLVAE